MADMMAVSVSQSFCVDSFIYLTFCKTPYKVQPWDVEHVILKQSNSK